MSVNQTAGPGASTTGNFFDNTKGNLVRHQLGHIQPIAIDAAYGDFLFAPNNAGQRLAMVHLPSLPGNALVAEIPTGPGITSLISRPTTAEGWAVDSVNGCVSVIDPILNRIMRTIQVGKEPHGIAMLADGSRAYVTCSASDSVDVIDCASYAVVKTIAIPARGPRGIAISNGKVWVVPLFSGNNTTARKLASSPSPFFAGSQEVVTPSATVNASPLADQDLFAISITSSPTTDALDGSQTRTGLGTILLNVHARPGTNELWIPNTEALNLTVGEANFINGQVVNNRITIVDISSPSSTPTFVPLDTIGNAAQPAAVAFDVPRNRAYVAAFGSDTIIVLNTAVSPPAHVGSYVLTPLTPALTLPGVPPTPARCGPRGLVMSANGNHLFVFNGIDNSFSRVDLTVATPGTVPIAISLGYDPTPDAVKRGIGHLANASHSGSGQSSCMSCHIDGQFDMLTWNLSAFKDPQGTINPPPSFEVDNKGPMTTQSLRGLFEAGRLHWRGEQASLDDFNEDGFVGLLNRSTVLPDHDFAEVKQGTFSLVYPANPREPADRVLTGAAATGLDVFRRRLAVSGSTCASCHILPLGTNTEIQAFVASASPSLSGKVPQLRGVVDKTGATSVTVFDTTYAASITHVVDRTINGWGLTHAGTLASVQHFASEFPGLTDAEVSDVAAFADVFDTGLAPATTYQRTLVPGVHSQSDFDAALLEIKTQARAGNCDIVVATAAPSGGVMVPVTFAWDHVLTTWQTGFATAAFTDLQLRTVTFDANLIVTFFGQPLGTGRRFGVDRDFDDLLDYDEASYTPSLPSDVVNPDSDGDTYPDGYEARHATGSPSLNPRVFNSSWTSPSNPQFIASPIVVYSTSSTAKLEFNTNRPTRAQVTTAGIDATTSPSSGGFDYNHAIHLRALPAGTPTTVTVQISDPGGGSATQNVTITTFGHGDGTHVAAITEQLTAGVPTSVDVRVGSTSGFGAGYSVTAFAYCDAPGVPLAPVTFSPATSTGTVLDATDTETFGITFPPGFVAGSATNRKLYFGVRAIVPPSGGLPYLEAFDVVNFKTITF